MGLDIKTRRLCKTDQGALDSADYEILEEDEVTQFKNAGLSDRIFARMETYYDFDEHLTKVVAPGSKMDDWQWHMLFWPEEFDDDACYIFKYLPTGQRYEIRCSEVLTFDKKENVVYFGKTLGYQRKGMKPQFCDDLEDGKLNYFVLDKATLEMYRDTYVVDEMKEYFQKNIIDTFRIFFLSILVKSIEKDLKNSYLKREKGICIPLSFFQA